MNDNFKREIDLINKVYEKLITTTNDEVAYELYKKCSSTFDKYQNTTDSGNFSNLLNTTNNIIGFREYIKECHPEKAFNNLVNEKSNNKVLELSNGHPIIDSSIDNKNAV